MYLRMCIRPLTADTSVGTRNFHGILQNDKGMEFFARLWRVQNDKKTVRHSEGANNDWRISFKWDSLSRQGGIHDDEYSGGIHDDGLCFETTVGGGKRLSTFIL